MLLHNHVKSQEKLGASRDSIPNSLSLLAKDTDGDGVNDAEDKCINEKGPVNNFGCPIIDNTLSKCHLNIGYAVYFVSGDFELSPKSINKLNEVVKILKDDPKLYIGLTGHADAVGDSVFNKKLSMARVEAVKAYLLKASITENRFKYVEVYGEKWPIADDRTQAGRASNRRVEINMNNEEYLY